MKRTTTITNPLNVKYLTVLI